MTRVMEKAYFSEIWSDAASDITDTSYVHLETKPWNQPSYILRIINRDYISDALNM